MADSAKGWTIETLKEYVDALSGAQKEAVATALASAKEAVSAAMVAAEKAVTKAEVATEKRLENVNEFRATLADQQNTFVRQDVSDARFRSLEAQLQLVINQSNKDQGRGDGRNQLWGYIVGAAGMAFAVAQYFKHP